MGSVKRFIGSFFGGKRFFILNYLFVVFACGVLVYFLWQDPTFKRLVEDTIDRWLAKAILIPFGLCLLAQIVIFINTVKEASVVELLVGGDDVKLYDGEVPLKNSFQNSMFVRHIQRFSVAHSNNWNRETKEELKDYLSTILFKAPQRIEGIGNLLPAIGLLGTVIGVYEVCVGRSMQTSMQLGIAHAIGTTAMGVISMIILKALNDIIFLEREELIQSALVVIRRAERKEVGHDDAKEQE